MMETNFILKKADLEKSIGKVISEDTFKLYLYLWEAYICYTRSEKCSLKDFLKLLNVKAIPEDEQLKKRLIEAKKRLPQIKKEMSDLQNKKAKIEAEIKYFKSIDDSINLSKQGFERLAIQKKLKKLKLEKLRLNKLLQSNK